jgi:hypothetical protein
MALLGALPGGWHSLRIINPAADAHAVSAAGVEGRWEIIASMAWRGLTGIATAGLFRMDVHLGGK